MRIKANYRKEPLGESSPVRFVRGGGEIENPSKFQAIREIMDDLQLK